MRITFIGATHEVTGSCTLVTVNNTNILIDCGMEQGGDTFENIELPVHASEIDVVVLTHAHIDHSGKIPMLYKNGFTGNIFATGATADLCAIMLRDSAYIQEMEAEWKNRKGARRGKEPVAPMYGVLDAEKTLELFVPCEYGAKVDIAKGVTIRFTDIGHLLGSAAVEMWLTEYDIEKKIVFSGDVGNINQPILRDPQGVDSADYVMIESTYGNRLHSDTRLDYVRELADVISRTFHKGGNVIIPSFAVGRTQEMLYFIRQIKEENLVPDFVDFPVYVDSPLAVEATQIFVNCHNAYFDEETTEILSRGRNPIAFPGLITTSSSEESKAINNDKRPKIIISASGMCEAGRIRHHLKHNLWRWDSTVLFVGYQANGTLGRALVEGATEVNLFGELVSVRAEICTLAGVSGHADRNGLDAWLTHFTDKPQMVFVNHGDDEACRDYVHHLGELGYIADAPYSGTVYDLAKGCFVKDTYGVAVQKKRAPSSAARDATERLVGAAERLASTARMLYGISNKDKAKFTSQIDALNEKMKKWLE